MVVAVVLSLAGLIKVGVSKTNVDNFVFRLHYRWTTSFCFLCCALLAASDLIGNPIECRGADQAAVTYCWVTSTYTINTTTKDHDFQYYKAYGSNYVGVGPYNEKLHEKTFHAYYQWVSFVLVFQGCLFYLPHTLWKIIEGKQLDILLQGLNSFAIADENYESKMQNIISYIKNSWGLNQKYCYGYMFCEVLNLFHVIGQLYLLDAFFGGMFLHLGTNILMVPTEDDRGRFDPLIETFPRITKCDFWRYGDSGTIENRDYLCVLPHNLLNEKIFIIMWVWFVFLAFVSAVQILFHLGVLIFPTLRVKLLEQSGKVKHSVEMKNLVGQMHFGDFFLIQALGKNVDQFCFKRLLQGLIEEMRTRHHNATKSVGFAENHSFESDFSNDTYLRCRNKMAQNSDV